MVIYMDTNVYLELNKFNDGENTTDCTVEFRGGNILNSDITNMWPYKFSLYTRNFPIYIPNILSPTAFKPYYPKGASEGNTTVLLSPVNGTIYKTDWSITVELQDNSGNSTFKNTPVYWERLYDVPQLQILPGSTMKARELIKNEYFWLKNSGELCEYINAALYRLLPNGFMIVKNADKWSILFNSEVVDGFGNVIVHLNPSMRSYFDFFYSINGTGITKTKQTTILNDDMYYMNTTMSSNNRLFPFNKLVFLSQRFPCFKMNIDNNNNVHNFSNSVLLSYDINITDISEIGDSITFSSECKDRSLTLTSSELPHFEISAMMSMRDGTMLPLSLKPGDMISFSLMFF